MDKTEQEGTAWTQQDGGAGGGSYCDTGERNVVGLPDLRGRGTRGAPAPGGEAGSPRCPWDRGKAGDAWDGPNGASAPQRAATSPKLSLTWGFIT